MTLQEYQINAKRTYPDLGSEKLNLSHMVLGFFSEYNEVKSAEKNMDLTNYGEELSDINWYLANYCTIRNYAFEDFYLKMHESRLSLSEDFSKLSDLVKKYIAYNKPIDVDYEIDLLKRIAYGLFDKYRANELDFKKCLENNINKLKVRFPDKFTEEKALNRNLLSERKELEK